MPNTTVDQLVIGSGALGSATAYSLSLADAGSVMMCEQFAPGHDRGSSNDHSRIIRHAYHSADYTALTPAMFAAWEQTEQDAGTQLVVRTGGLDFARTGTAGEDMLHAYRASLDAAALPYDVLDAREAMGAWPQWNLPDDAVAMYQADAGLLDIRRATSTQVRLAQSRGVEVRAGCTVLDIIDQGSHLEVLTSDDTIIAGSVVVCAGSWVSRLLTRLGVDIGIELTQEQVQYFAPARPQDYAPDRFPIWIWHEDSDYYGFPVYGENAVKAARDMSGRFVTQDTRSFLPDDDETSLVRDFLATRLHGAAGPSVAARTCVYDLPRDRELVLGPLPGHPNIQIAVGAGHAGKFAALIGQILADLATTGTTPHPIEPFSAARPSLRHDAPAQYRLGAAVAAG